MVVFSLVKVNWHLSDRSVRFWTPDGQRLGAVGRGSHLGEGVSDLGWAVTGGVPGLLLASHFFL